MLYDNIFIYLVNLQHVDNQSTKSLLGLHAATTSAEKVNTFLGSPFHFISEKGYGIPVVMLLLEGGTDAILDASQSLKEGIPVVVCSGTGRAADLLTYAHKILSKDRRSRGLNSFIYDHFMFSY